MKFGSTVLYAPFSLIWYATWLLSEKKMTFDPTPGIKGVCKDRLCAYMVLNSLKTWYATWLVTFRKKFWPLNPHKRVECVFKDRICACMLLAFMIPFNLLCNMNMLWKIWIMTFSPSPQGRGGGGRGGLGTKHLLLCCCIWYATSPYSEKIEFWLCPIPKPSQGVRPRPSN